MVRRLDMAVCSNKVNHCSPTSGRRNAPVPVVKQADGGRPTGSGDNKGSACQTGLADKAGFGDKAGAANQTGFTDNPKSAGDKPGLQRAMIIPEIHIQSVTGGGDSRNEQDTESVNPQGSDTNDDSRIDTLSVSSREAATCASALRNLENKSTENQYDTQPDTVELPWRFKFLLVKRGTMDPDHMETGDAAESGRRRATDRLGDLAQAVRWLHQELVSVFLFNSQVRTQNPVVGKPPCAFTLKRLTENLCEKNASVPLRENSPEVEEALLDRP